MINTIQQMLISLGTIMVYLLILSLIQLTGFFIFFSYYIKFRKTRKGNRFLIYSIGWILGIFGTFSFLISMYGGDPIASYAYILSGVFLVLSTLYIGCGIISYFTPTKKEHLIIINFIFIIVPVVSMALFGRTGSAFSITLENVAVYLFLLIIGIVHRQKVIIYSKVSYFLFLTGVTVSLILLLATEFRGDSELFVILYFGIQNWLQLILIVFLIHLEHSISIQDTYKLKDTYSHDLANRMQKIVGFLDLAIMSNDTKPCEEARQTTIDANDLLLEIRKLL